MHWSNFHLCMPGWHIMLFSSFSSNSSSRSSSMAVAMLSTPNAETFTETTECRPDAKTILTFCHKFACLHLSTFSPFPAWLMDPVSLPHWPLLFTPNVHTSPFLVRTHVWALPMATWVTKLPFKSVTWPVEEEKNLIKLKYYQLLKSDFIIATNKYKSKVWRGCFASLTSAITVNSIFSKHVELSILGNNAAASIVTSCIHGCLSL